jgi:Zn-dependent peptidase ImmA (M78 family)/DNA-binding transcriptional regulator YiaG
MEADMSAGNIPHWVKPEVLRTLRERVGLQYDEIEQRARKLKRAHYTAVTRQELERWEQGLESPDLEHLETLSEIYHYPVGYFFLHELPETSLPFGYRGLAAGKEGRLGLLTQQTLRRFLDLSDWMAALLEEHGIAWEVTIRPTKAQQLEQLIEQERERLGFSEQVRQGWETAEDALAWWRRQVEAQGVFVFEMKLDPGEVRGASRWVASRFPFILVNHQDAETATGRLFTLLHEYAHLLTIQEGITCDFRGSGEEGQSIESFANRFAARMLLPFEQFRQSLQQAGKLQFKENWSDAELDALRRPFFVSRDVIAIALQEMGLAPAGFYQKKREQWERRRPWGRAKTRRSLTKKERKAREIGSSALRVLLALEEREALPLMDAASALDMKVEKVLEFLKWARAAMPPDG